MNFRNPQTKTAIIITIVVGLISCSTYKEIYCPNLGRKKLVLRKPEKYMENHVKMSRKSLEGSGENIVKIGKIRGSFSTNDTVVMVNEKLSNKDQMIDRIMTRARNLANEDPCKEETTQEYQKLIDSVKTIYSASEDFNKTANEIIKGANFGLTEERELLDLLGKLNSKLPK